MVGDQKYLTLAQPSERLPMSKYHLFTLGLVVTVAVLRFDTEADLVMRELGEADFLDRTLISSK